MQRSTFFSRIKNTHTLYDDSILKVRIKKTLNLNALCQFFCCQGLPPLKSLIPKMMSLPIQFTVGRLLCAIRTRKYPNNIHSHIHMTFISLNMCSRNNHVRACGAPVLNGTAVLTMDTYHGRRYTYTCSIHSC